MRKKRILLIAAAFSLVVCGSALAAPVVGGYDNEEPGVAPRPVEAAAVPGTGTGEGMADGAVSETTPPASSYWYDQMPELDESERIFYHYRDQHWRYLPDKDYSKVAEQVDRILENPCHETAVQEMVWVEIPVWRLRDGQKIPDVTKVQVLSSIADEVKAVFTDIYNGPEQFPIESVGGYSWRENGVYSEHSLGYAIDINPEHNPQIDEDGTILVGGKWEPGVNPYSISRDSDVLKVFGKYSWDWGVRYRRKDFMHFSY